MKKSTSLLATLMVLASALPVVTKAANQVYDLKDQWSDTANPNGTWSYRQGDSLLVNTPFPWVNANSTLCASYPDCPSFFTGDTVITKATQTFVDGGYDVAIGDVYVNPGAGGNILWTAPASGTISISGAVWLADPFGLSSETGWSLWLDGNPLSDGVVQASPPGPAPILEDSGVGYTRSSPYDLSQGSSGAAALQKVPVAAEDEVVLAFNGEGMGVNFTITFTPDSIDPVTALQDLASTVAEMDLLNGIENSLDSKLDAALGALDDLNANDDAAACNSLEAFINAVEAQRGNQLTDAQADQLIASAQQIQSALNCGE